MKNLKKILAVLLSVLMIVTVFAACGNNGDNDADAGKGVTVKSVEGLSEESEENDEYGDDDEEEGESEIASIEFRTKIGSCTQEKPRILYDGEDNYYDDEDGYIRYNLRFMKGDELIVNYTDPEKEASHYFYYRYGDFYDSEIAAYIIDTSKSEYNLYELFASYSLSPSIVSMPLFLFVQIVLKA